MFTGISTNFMMTFLDFSFPQNAELHSEAVGGGWAIETSNGCILIFESNSWSTEVTFSAKVEYERMMIDILQLNIGMANVNRQPYLWKWLAIVLFTVRTKKSNYMYCKSSKNEHWRNEQRIVLWTTILDLIERTMAISKTKPSKIVFKLRTNRITKYQIVQQVMASTENVGNQTVLGIYSQHVRWLRLKNFTQICRVHRIVIIPKMGTGTSLYEYPECILFVNQGLKK